MRLPGLWTGTALCLLLSASPLILQPARADETIDGTNETVIGTGGGTIASPWTIVNVLTIGNTGTGGLAVSGGGQVSDGIGTIANEAGSTGTVTVDGSGSSWTNTDQLSVGLRGDGHLTVSGGASVEGGFGATIGGYEGATGEATITGTGSQFNGSAWVGTLGVGYLNLTDNATFNGSMQLGFGDSGNGSVTISGGASLDAGYSNARIDVGFAGTGTMTVFGGSSVVVGDSSLAGTTSIGYSAGGSGVLNIRGTGTSYENKGSLLVGESGTGTLNLSGGASLHSTGTSIGDQEGSDGTVNVSGSGTTLTNDNLTFIGFHGTAKLNISDLATMQDNSVLVGDYANASVKLDTGALWSISNVLALGGYADGDLTVSGGADLQVTGTGPLSGTLLGADAGSHGTITVTGSGSTWTNPGLVEVGQDGIGMATIAAGGALTANEVDIATQSGGTGTVTVTGDDGSAPSTLTAATAIKVGVAGNGTLNVADGANVFTARTEIASADGAVGTVNISGAGTSWASTDTIGVGNGGTGKLTISDGASLTGTELFVGSVSTSSGTVTLSGSGTIISMSGGIVAGFNGSGAITVANGAKLDNAAGAVLGGTTNSDGSVTVSGTGSSWTNNALAIGSTGSGEVTISDGGEVSSNTAINLAIAAGSTGTVAIGAAEGNAAVAPGTLVAPSLDFGSGTGKLVFNHTGSAYAFSTDMTGSGTIAQLAGVTKLTGDASGFTGTTAVTGGSLYVNTTLNGTADVTGGTLGGSGTVGTLDIASGGTVAPGNSIGTLHVSGPVTFAAGSTYAAEVNAIGDADLLSATGAVTINGGTVKIVPYPDYSLGTTYTILTTAGAISGRFDDASFAGSVFVVPNLSYTGNFVYAVLNAVPFTSVARTPNERAAAGGLEALGAGNPLYDATFALTTADAANQAFDALSGEIHASVTSALIEDSHFMRDTAYGRLRRTPEPGHVLWGQAFGGLQSAAGDGNAAAFDARSGGLAIGADGVIGNWRAGLFAGYSRLGMDVADRGSSATVTGAHLGVYGGTTAGNLAVRFGGAYGHDWLDTSRTASFSGFSDSLSASYQASSAQAFGELAYTMTAGTARFTPFAGFATILQATDGFTESGGAAALTGKSDVINATFSTLGLRAETNLPLEGALKAKISGMIGWQHGLFGTMTPQSTETFPGGTAFTVSGTPMARDSAIVAGGLDLKISKTATVNLNYTGRFASGVQGHSLKASFDVRF